MQAQTTSLQRKGPNPVQTDWRSLSIQEQRLPTKSNAYQTLLKSGELKDLVDKGVFADIEVVPEIWTGG